MFPVFSPPPPRDYVKYRTKISAVTFPFKPLQSSWSCVSELPFLKKNTLCFTCAWFSSSQQRRSDPLHTYSASSPKFLCSSYIKLISCENSQLIYIIHCKSETTHLANFAPHQPNIPPYITIFILTYCIYSSKIPPHRLLRVGLSERRNNIFTSQDFFGFLLLFITAG